MAAGSVGHGHHHHHKGGVVDDTAVLAALGHEQKLKRQFTPLSMLGLAFAIINTWTALSASLNLALPSGGSTAVLWGLLTSGFCNLALAASLAEFLSAYPTAGGQYHWVAITSWRSWMPILSWICGWINVFGWIALSATVGAFCAEFILSFVPLFHANYVAESWHIFLVYLAVTTFMALVNVFGNRFLPYFNKFAITWSLMGFAIISITVLACGSPDYNSADVVFGTFINETGWPDGLAWLIGLLQGTLSLVGFDATAHMVEEIPNASVEAPKILIYAILIGTSTGFIVCTCLLFVAGDLYSVITASEGPLAAIFLRATGSRNGTVCLLILPLGCLIWGGISIFTTSSRMVYAFARDGGLPFSRYLSRVHPTLDVPLQALGATVLSVVAFGCIYLGSSAAFSAIVSACVVSLGVSYGMPPAISLLRGRRMLPAGRHFKMPEWLGWSANIIGVLFVTFTSVLFLFPPALPVTPSSMNYCIVAFAVVLVISTVQWFTDGRKNYKGPKIDIDEAFLVALENPDADLEMKEGGSEDSKR